MAVLEILEYPNPELKKVSETVSKIDEETKTLIADMLETMYDAPGVGLAAPQVGHLKRIIVIDISEKDDESEGPIVLINPEIISCEGKILFEEGCLSVPEYTADVSRYAKVAVKGLNENSEEVIIEDDGLLSVVLQHEIDHLDGILFVDKLGLIKRDIFKRKYKKMLKKRAAETNVS